MKASSPNPPRLVLVTIWCRTAPERLGELLVPPSTPMVFGRHPAGPGRLPLLAVQRGQAEARPPIRSERLSRDQLTLDATPSGVVVRNLGRRTLLVDGTPCSEALLCSGQRVAVDGELAWLVEERAVVPAAQARFDLDLGRPDAGGQVGESPALWSLRRRLLAAAHTDGPLALVGPDGSGRTLAARFLHYCAADERPLHLHIDGGPPPPARARVIIPASASLEALRHRNDLRFLHLAASPPPDLPAIAVPGLDTRRSDVPMLMRSRLLHMALEDPTSLSRHLEESGEVKVGLDLVEQLVDWPYTRHLHELDELLWRSVATSPRTRLSAIPSTP